MDSGDSTPKKYIRTLAGDIDIVKTGGIPNLVPLSEIKKDTPSPTERLVAPSPVTPITSAQLPNREPTLLSNLKPSGQVIQPPKTTVPISIKTYESDFSNRMKEEHASPVTLLAVEQDAGPKTYQQETVDPQQKNSMYIVGGGVALVLFGIIGVYFAYKNYSSSLATMVLAPVVSAPIFVDDRQEISGDGIALLREVEQSVVHSLAAGGVRFLYTESATDSTNSLQAGTNNDIFSAMFRNQASDILLRNLNPKSSMTGIVNIGGNQSPFFLISVTSYKDTFAGMLAWEPVMQNDLKLLFPLYPDSATTTSTITTTQPQPSVTTGNFYDEVVNNHDVREYRDTKGRIILLYGYWDQNTLIIARDEASFSEIVRRLGIAKTK